MNRPLSITCSGSASRANDQRVFGQQRQERIGGIVVRSLGESQQALIEAGMASVSTSCAARRRFMRISGTTRPTAIARPDPEEQNEAADDQAGRREARA